LTAPPRCQQAPLLSPRQDDPALASPAESRFTLRRLAGSGRASFADDVRRGLSATPKFLLAKYFYDELGSRLFEAITVLPEYYVTRAETAVLTAHAGEIAAAVPGPVRLVELGSGDARKTRLLIAALLARQETLEYLPIDVAESALARSGEELTAEFPALSVTGYVADYHDALSALAADLRSPAGPESGIGAAEAARKRRTLILFLGSTLGNLNADGQAALLREVRATLVPGDGFLLGTDLRKPLSELIPAYDDALGVTAAFNLNILLRINRELGGDFDLRAFRHRARYDELDHRIEMHLESRAAQRARIAGLDLTIDLREGETIWTESSFKFSPEQVAALAAATCFRLERTWTDEGNRFGSHLLLAV